MKTIKVNLHPNLRVLAEKLKAQGKRSLLVRMASLEVAPVRQKGCGKKTKEERFLEFWNKVAIKEEDECWMFSGRGDFYGTYNWMGIRQHSHRLTWFICFGRIPKKMRICHKCDVMGCVNPKHLFMGTAKDNSQDMVKKGRGGMRFALEKSKQLRAMGIKVGGLPKGFSPWWINGK